ncbi:MAG: tRNA lysidine(34) synthetase TilS [Ruminococcus sp.]|uniref:tRNA lysidine(34) synthetase TilS n=1 Tax=Ruminococcus sp. TaxID=41978 RepID=UPI002872E83E|nr:tRNA lysidine(34) synthetase TilS [Ruminococcus sp.]MBQ3285805.1 tRNA lysidine(34) synthetase TilS [Ruminococcus sp.]
MSNDLQRNISRFIEERSLLQNGDKVIVALSGGADSVELLHVLISLKEKYSFTIYAAHMNHGIRGAEADRDEAFVRELCERWGIRLFSEKADVPAIAAETGESLELCGRRLRYEFFNRVAKESGGAKIATAHHGDDNVETVLWNLTRGTGIGGLCGIPAQRDNIIRPLLCCTRDDIEAYCTENGLEYVVDSTNLSDDYTRNKLRHQVTPVLRELNPNVSETIGRSADLMRDADDYFNNISQQELKRAETNYGYSCSELLCLEPIVLKYAVKNILEKAGAPVDFRHIALIIEAMREGGTVELGQGFTASCAQGTLRVIGDSTDSSGGFCIPFEEFIRTGGMRIRINNGKLDLSESDLEMFGSDAENVHNLLLHHCIPCDIITSDTYYRSRRAGDTFTDARRGVTKSVKKLMNEMKIPRELRDTVPLIADGPTVLWIEGVGTSSQAKPDLTRCGEVYIIIGG